MTERSREQSDQITEVLSHLQTTSRWQEHVYKQIHSHPELSFQETKTAALAAAKLKELGYEVVEGIGRTGVVGILRNGEGQTVLARADMDALPVKENTGLPYASTVTAADDTGETVSAAHACGHDAHVTCLLGAAEVLANARRSWGGTFIALFQPAEEVAGGAKAMLTDGLRERIPKPDVAFAQHVLAYPAGTIGTQVGPVLSAGDSIRLTALLTLPLQEQNVCRRDAVQLPAQWRRRDTPRRAGSGSASFTAMSDLFLGRTDNVAIRFAAGVALLFNVLMVIIAIIAIIVTVPKDDRFSSRA